MADLESEGLISYVCDEDLNVFMEGRVDWAEM